MSQVIVLKRSAVGGKPPAVADLQFGEVAINTYDGKLFIRKNNGTDSIVDIGTQTLTGDATGTGNGSIAVTLAPSGVVAGTFTKLTVDAKGRATFGAQLASADVTTALGYTPVNPNIQGMPNGLATLDASGKLLTNQVPTALVGALQYQGTWNASTNTPALVSGTGTKGQYYKVSVAGTTPLDGQAQWSVGDMVVFDGTTWDSIDGLTSEVTSVAGRIGAVVLSNTDISGLGTLATQNGTFSGSSSGVNTGDETNATILNKLAIPSISGTNTGDETLATIKSKLGITTLSGVNTGDQTLASLGAEAVANKDVSNGYAGLTLLKLNLRNVANTVTSWFTNSNTAARTYTLPDKDGTVALTSDFANYVTNTQTIDGGTY